MIKTKLVTSCCLFFILLGGLQTKYVCAAANRVRLCAFAIFTAWNAKQGATLCYTMKPPFLMWKCPKTTVYYITSTPNLAPLMESQCWASPRGELLSHIWAPNTVSSWDFFQSLLTGVTKCTDWKIKKIKVIHLEEGTLGHTHRLPCCGDSGVSKGSLKWPLVLALLGNVAFGV